MSIVAERMIESNGAEICTDAFGDPADPPILLVMGMSASMVWWEEEFCVRLADERRFVTASPPAFPPLRSTGES